MVAGITNIKRVSRFWLKALGIDEFKRQVEADWADLKDGPGTLTIEEVNRVASSLLIRRMKH
jgi:hypothetical protein